MSTANRLANLAGDEADEGKAALNRTEEARLLPAALAGVLLLQGAAVAAGAPISPNDAHHPPHHPLAARRDLMLLHLIHGHLSQRAPALPGGISQAMSPLVVLHEHLRPASTACDTWAETAQTLKFTWERGGNHAEPLQ